MSGVPLRAVPGGAVDPMLDAVAKMLIVAFEQQRKPPAESKLDDPDYLQSWVVVLQGAGVDPRDVGPAYARYAATSEYFPAPANIVSHARAAQSDRLTRQLAAAQQQQALPASASIAAVDPAERQSVRQRLGITDADLQAAQRRRQDDDAGESGLRLGRGPMMIDGRRTLDNLKENLAQKTGDSDPPLD